MNFLDSRGIYHGGHRGHGGEGDEFTTEGTEDTEMRGMNLPRRAQRGTEGHRDEGGSCFWSLTFMDSVGRAYICVSLKVVDKKCL